MRSHIIIHIDAGDVQVSVACHPCFTGMEPCLCFMFLKCLLLPAEAIWMHTEVCLPNALMHWKNHTGNAEKITLALVYSCYCL